MTALQKIFSTHGLDTFEKKKAFLTAHPYNLHVSEAKSEDLKGLWIAKYDQVKTNFTEEFCKEARGIIFDGDKVVCYPFKKFFNSGEKHADVIDWSTATVLHKYDGSIIKIYWLEANEKRPAGKWMVATNGTIDAKTATVDEQNGVTFYDLFEEARKLCNLDFNRLDKKCTYMFELMHPKSLIVVRYTVPRLVHIGTRNNITFQESYENIGVEQAEVFSLTSLEECVDAAAKLGQFQEGFVVVDSQYNRNKIKGSVYLTLHHTLTNNHLTTEEAAGSLVLRNEQSEVQAYQENPEMVEICQHVVAIEKRMKNFLTALVKTYQQVQDKKLSSRKDIASAYRAASSKHFAFFMARVTYEEKFKGDDRVPLQDFFQQYIFGKMVGGKNAKIDRATIREFLELIKEN